jgi:sulfatase maturation enzyme AslB (radical SAM superfamily)
MNNDLQIKYSFVSETDYDEVKGSDWPSFRDFQAHRQIPKWVYDEIDAMLTKSKPFDHPSFCVLPWHGKELYFNGAPTHCCLLPQTYDIDKIRSEMKQGIRPRECGKCWHLEDHNLLSDRQIKNSALDFYLKKNIQDIMLDATEEKIFMVKTITSFTCNGACIYCNSKSSSYWNIIERRIDSTIPIRSYNFIGLDGVEKEINLAEIKTLSLIGGEPLLERRNFEILQRLIDVGNTDVFISVVTNASIDLSPVYRSMLASFPNLNLCLSIDGRHGIFDYQRWPLKWSDVERNIETYRTLTNNISVNCTISNVSVLYYDDIKTWFKSQQIPWLPNPVHEPEIFSPKNLPVSTKLYLRDVLDSDDYHAFIGDPYHQSPGLWQDFLEQINKQDQAKGINIRNFVPEFCDLVGI